MPHELDAEPTVELIREMFEWIHDARSGWSQQRALDDRLRPLIRLEHAVAVSNTDAPERKNRLRPERMDMAEGPRTIQVISSLFNAPPTIGVMFIGEGSRNPAKADEMEVQLAELSDQLNPPTDSSWLRGVHEMIAFGRMAMMYLPGDAYWWDAPRQETGEADSAFMVRYKEWQRKAPVPILCRDLPAASTFPPSLGAINDVALCTLRTSWYELAEIFTDEELAEARPTNINPYAAATLTIFANRAWVSYAVMSESRSGLPGFGHFGFRGFQDKIIRSIEHKLNRCPIRILPGKTGPKEPGQYWRSVLHNVIDMIPQLDARAGEAATASRMSVLPWLKWWSNRGGETTASDDIQQLLHGDLVELDAGNPATGEGREDIAAIHIPPFGRENMELLALQRDTIRDVTGAVPALTGNIDIGSGPAWSLNWTGEMAKQGHGDLTQAIIGARVAHMEMLIKCVEAFGETITLTRHDDKGGNITVDPEEIGKWEPILKGDYKPRVPINEIAMIQTAIATMQAIDASNLPIDQFYIMERYLDIEQPHQMWQRSLKTRLIRRPEVEDWYSKIMLEEADIELGGDEGISIEEFEALAAGMPPGAADVVRQKVGVQGSEAKSAGIRGAPFSRQPGGPRPQEVVS